MSAELLPCPFCGSAPVWADVQSGGWTVGYQLRCPKCYCVRTNEFLSGDIHDVHSRNEAGEATKAAWNARSPSAQPSREPGQHDCYAVPGGKYRCRKGCPECAIQVQSTGKPIQRYVVGMNSPSGRPGLFEADKGDALESQVVLYADHAAQLAEEQRLHGEAVRAHDELDKDNECLEAQLAEAVAALNWQKVHTEIHMDAHGLQAEISDAFNMQLKEAKRERDEALALAELRRKALEHESALSGGCCCPPEHADSPCRWCRIELALALPAPEALKRLRMEAVDATAIHIGGGKLSTWDTAAIVAKLEKGE